jgi:hypothetical protein
MAQVVHYLPGKDEALSSILITHTHTHTHTHTKKQQNKLT